LRSPLGTPALQGWGEFSWGKLVGTIKFAFDEETLQELRESYRYDKELLTVKS
jgi:hypothetical protein